MFLYKIFLSVLRKIARGWQKLFISSNLCLEVDQLPFFIFYKYIKFPEITDKRFDLKKIVKDRFHKLGKTLSFKKISFLFSSFFEIKKKKFNFIDKKIFGQIYYQEFC